MKNSNSEIVSILKNFQNVLPHAVFEESPSYPKENKQQKEFYKTKLRRQIDYYLKGYEDICFTKFKITPERAQAIHNTLVRTFTPEQSTKLLIDIETQNKFTEDLRQKALQYAMQTEKFNEDYETLRKEIHAVQDEVNKKEVELNTYTNTNSSKELTMKIRKLEVEKQDLEQLIQKDIEKQNKLEKISRVKSIIQRYRNKVRKELVEELQKEVNLYFNILMTSHSQIKKITLDPDTLNWDFHGSNENLIGKANISSGMKQQVATAMIWAFQKVLRTDFPIIIDTPLARIDREHQEILIKEYYPNAGDQVFILPTNSELDKEKYGWMKSYIKNEFLLENQDGATTKIKMKAMYNL